MASPQAEPAFDSKTLRRECKMYMALHQCGMITLVLVFFNLMTVYFYSVFSWAFTITSILASLAFIGVLFLRQKFLRWPANRQIEFLYSRQSKQAIVVGVVCATILVLMPIMLAGPVVLSVGLGATSILMPSVFIATSLWMAGRHYREGTSVHCASCDYEQGLPPEGADISPKCPECGRRWLVRGGTVIGKPAPDRSLIIASMFFIAIAIGVFSTEIIGLSSGTVRPGISLASNASLIQLAKAGGYESSKAWDELVNRKLDPEQVDELLGLVVAQHYVYDLTLHYANDWIKAAAIAGMLQPEHVLKLLSLGPLESDIYRYWKHVIGLQFTPDQMAQLGEQAIAYAKKNSFLPFDADVWLQNAYDKGLFPASINERLKPYLDP